MRLFDSFGNARFTEAQQQHRQRDAFTHFVRVEALVNMLIRRTIVHNVDLSLVFCLLSLSVYCLPSCHCLRPFRDVRSAFFDSFGIRASRKRSSNRQCDAFIRLVRVAALFNMLQFIGVAI